VEKLYDELDFQRAVQVYLWSNIMASFGAIRDEYRRRGASSFDALLYERLLFRRKRHLCPAAYSQGGMR